MMCRYLMPRYHSMATLCSVTQISWNCVTKLKKTKKKSKHQNMILPILPSMAKSADFAIEGNIGKIMF